jgi:hypothetical protein
MASKSPGKTPRIHTGVSSTSTQSMIGRRNNRRTVKTTLITSRPPRVPANPQPVPPPARESSARPSSPSVLSSAATSPAWDDYSMPSSDPPAFDLDSAMLEGNPPYPETSEPPVIVHQMPRKRIRVSHYPSSCLVVCLAHGHRHLPSMHGILTAKVSWMPCSFLTVPELRLRE